MKKIGKKDKIVFVEEYSPLGEMWLETLESRDINAHGIVLEDAPFLPYNMTSIYECFLRKEEKRELKIKDLFYVFVDIPEYWEVQVDGLNGVIINNGKRMATIYFKMPIEKRNVSRIEWMQDNEKVYKIDYYNRYGIAYCSALIDDNGEMLSKTYFTSENQDVININYSNGVVTLFERGYVVYVCSSIAEFERYAFSRLHKEYASWIATSSMQMQWMVDSDDIELSNASITLWKEKDVDYYRNNICSHLEQVPVYVINNYDTGKCNIENMGNEKWVCVSPKKYPEIKGNAEALIYTYSDNLYGMEDLIESLPEVKFHIAANTEVSQKLYDMSEKKNVFVHPGIGRQELKHLYERCDFLLDINDDREVDNAVIEAARNNILILGYEKLIHNKAYMLDECVFGMDEKNLLIQKIRHLTEDKKELDKLTKSQQDKIRESTRFIVE